MNQERTEVKTCKHCGATIPETAKYCPYCNKRQENGWMITVLNIVCALMVLMGVFIIVKTDNDVVYRVVRPDSTGAIVSADEKEKNSDKYIRLNSDEEEEEENSKKSNSSSSSKSSSSDSDDEESSSSSSSKSSSSSSDYTIGSKFTFDKVTATLNSVTTSNGNEYSKPETGNVFLVANWTISNDRSEEFDPFDFTTTGYVDGASTELAITSLPDQFNRSAMIIPDSSTTGNIIYEVPEDWQKFQIRAQIDNVNGDTAIFEFTSSQVDK